MAAALVAAASPASAQVRFGGSVSTGIQLRLTGCGADGGCRLLNFRNANVVQLTIDAQPTSTTELFGDVSVRNINFSTIETLDDAGEISKVQPVDIRVNEARVSLFDLFSAKGLDLSVGALKLAWGTADGHNPVDIANPYDLEEGAAYDQRLASLALQLSYSVGDWRIEAVALPLFLPAILPIEHIDFTALGDPADVLDLTEDDDSPATIEKVETPTTLPDFAAENIQAGARIKYTGPIGDLSVVFFRGFESLPQASGTVRLTGFQTQNRVDLGVPLVYPKVMMTGLTYRGTIADRLGLWAEAALFFPSRHELVAAKNQLEALVKLGRLDEVPDPLPSQETQSSDMYVKAVAGVEYVFFDRWYLNLQYSRGMPTERQASDIHEYVLLGTRLTLLDGKLVLGVRGALEIADSDTLAWQASGRIAWLHGDAAEISLGATFIDGQKATTFDRFEDLSHAKLAVKLGF